MDLSGGYPREIDKTAGVDCGIVRCSFQNSVAHQVEHCSRSPFFFFLS